MGNDDLETRLMLIYPGKAVVKKGKESRKRVTMTQKTIDVNLSG